MSCEYCESGLPLISNFYGWNLLVNQSERGKPYLTIECVSGCTRVGIGINNCPMCGEKLGDGE